MSIRNLGAALHPGSVAVIGADPSPGRLVLGNIVAGGFEGPVWPVDPGPAAMRGLPCFPDVAALPGVPDLGVVATPPAEVPAAVAALGARGCRVAVVVTGGLDPAARQAMLDAARPHLLRVIGPDALGVIVPEARLNASLAGTAAEPGRLALVSQSGAIAIGAARLGGRARHRLQPGDGARGAWPTSTSATASTCWPGTARTRAILVYLESVPAPRKFLSAARAASRLKPVIALKAGRAVEAARAAATHTGALVRRRRRRRRGAAPSRGAPGERPLRDARGGRDGRRASGRCERARLGDRHQQRRRRGARARPASRRAGGQLAELAPETLAGLGAALASGWSGANPVDLMRRCRARSLSRRRRGRRRRCRRRRASWSCTRPSALADAGAAAAVIAGRGERGLIAGKPVLACWMGGSARTRRAGGAARRRRRQLRHAVDRRGRGRAPDRLGQGAGGAASRPRPPRRGRRRRGAGRAGGGRGDLRRRRPRAAEPADRAGGAGGARAPTAFRRPPAAIARTPAEAGAGRRGDAGRRRPARGEAPVARGQPQVRHRRRGARRRLGRRGRAGGRGHRRPARAGGARGGARRLRAAADDPPGRCAGADRSASGATRSSGR